MCAETSSRLLPPETLLKRGDQFGRIVMVCANDKLPYCVHWKGQNHATWMLEAEVSPLVVQQSPEDGSLSRYCGCAEAEAEAKLAMAPKVALTENDKRFLRLWPNPDSRWLRARDVADRLGVAEITAGAALSRLVMKNLLEKRGNRKIDRGAVEFLYFTTDLGDTVVKVENLSN